MTQLELDQVRELGRQALAAERERCAKIAEGFVDAEWPNDDQSNQAKAIASAIRGDKVDTAT